MKSNEFLQAAIDVQKERGAQYDKPSGERSMGATVAAFNCITGNNLKEQDGWMLLGLLKLVRQSQNPEKYHHDSALDFVAYASLYAEAASEQCKPIVDPVKKYENSPKWEESPVWANWLCQDRSGAWHWFSVKPYSRTDAWDFKESDARYSLAARSSDINEDWINTLVARPQQ